MRVQSVNLNLIPTGVMPIVHLSQYDRDADGALLFNIFNGPAPFNLTGCTATINGTKPDGNVYTYPCTVHSNFLTSAVYDQMTTVQGTHEAEIRISDGDSVVGTLNFQMAIEKAGVSEIDVSHTDVPTLLENIQASVDEAEYWAEQAAGAVAGVASFNGRHGSVLPVAGDYDASQISYGDRTVEDALDGMGGHTILNASGQEMPQRKNLRFAGANLSDDAQNDTTNVTITGGSGGSTITVTTIETTLYGETVTITDGTSTFTGVFDNSGVCVIDGVTATGTLTVTSGGATRQLTVPYYGNYEVALSFWSAEITVTTDPGVNSAIVKKDGVNVGTISFSAGTGTYIAGSTGAYTFTATVGGVEFTSPTVNVTQQTTYSTIIDIFNATLSISTSSSELYGKTITIKKGSTTVGTTAFSAQGSASYTVHETGTYTFDCEGYTATQAVSEQTTYNVSINAGLDLSAWISAGSTTDYPLNPSSYADFSALEADEAAVRQLMLVHDAVDYLAQATAGDSLMESVIGSDVCAKWINLTDYALDTLYANSDIADEMDTADKYGYGEWVKLSDNPETWGAKGNVPIMTSDTAPYGTAIANSETGAGSAAYIAFNGNKNLVQNNRWTGYIDANNTYLGFHFVNPVNVKRFSYIQAENDFSDMRDDTVHIEYSLDGTTWTTLSQAYSLKASEATTEKTEGVETDVFAPYWAVKFTNGNFNAGTPLAMMLYLQFYGRELKPLVPTMTANDKPKGECIGGNGTGNLFNAFDGNASTYYAVNSTNNSWVGYDFGVATKIKIAYLNSVDVNSFKIQQSADKSTWSDVSGTVTTSGNIATKLTDSANARYYKLLPISTDNWGHVNELQFYGMDYSEKEFATGSTRKTIYDHGVELVNIARSGHNSSYSEINTEYPEFAENGAYVGKNTGNTMYVFVTNATIETTGRNTLNIIADPFNPYGSGEVAEENGALGYTISKNPSGQRYFDAYQVTGFNKQYSYDISNVNGSNYLGFMTISAARKATVYELWLE